MKKYILQNKMRYYIGIFLILALIIFLYMFATTILLHSRKFKSSYSKAEVKIGDNKFTTDIADTSIKQMLGLSGRKSLAENNGMLFIFKTSKNRTFWMKDMNFPLDIIWINGDKIIKISKNIQPPSVAGKILTENSESPADKVLEINGGLSDKLNIKEGDKIDISFIKDAK